MGTRLVLKENRYTWEPDYFKRNIEILGNQTSLKIKNTKTY